ncbi:hypothetical protein [Nonomuraea sp. NPDC002799]
MIVMINMSEQAQSGRFRHLPERPDPTTWQADVDDRPLPQAIAEPAEVGDTGLPWMAPELEAAQQISNALVRRRSSGD